MNHYKKKFISLLIVSCFISFNSEGSSDGEMPDIEERPVVSSKSVSLDIEEEYDGAKECYDRKDYGEALIKLRVIVEQTHDPTNVFVICSQSLLGRMYYNGEGVDKDLTEAEKWLKQAAKKGHVLSQIELGRMYFYERGNFSRAFKCFKVAADDITIRNCELRDFNKPFYKIAQFYLGRMYYKGYGVSRDFRTAIKWLGIAVDNGCIEAQDFLKSVFHKEKGIYPYLLRVLNWYEEIKESSEDPFSVDVMGFEPQNISQYIKRAFYLVRSVAEQGHDRDAQYCLGEMYYQGWGTYQDSRAALAWFRQAAEQGSKRAAFRISCVYKEGIGRVSQDMEESLIWLERAAELKHGKAQYYLGKAYEMGRGVLKNDRAALKWYEQAYIRVMYVDNEHVGTTVKRMREKLSFWKGIR